MDAVGLKPGGLIDGFPVAGVFCMQQLHHVIDGYTVRDDGIGRVRTNMSSIRPVRIADHSVAAAREPQDAARIAAIIVAQSLPLVAQVIDDDNELVAAFMDNRRANGQRHRPLARVVVAAGVTCFPNQRRRQYGGDQTSSLVDVGAGRKF